MKSEEEIRERIESLKKQKKECPENLYRKLIWAHDVWELNTQAEINILRWVLRKK